MCLIAFALQANPQWPLVLASNRDEAHDRPTAPLASWTSPRGHTLVSGRDLRDGGAWLGASGSGRIAMLTNVRSGTLRSGPRSRGELVTRWLDGDEDFNGYCGALDLQAQADRFGGFNLVVGDWARGQWNWLTNRAGGQAGVLQSRALEPGIYGLSNGALDTPWPKTLALKAAVGAALVDEHSHSFDGLVDSLMPHLLDRTPAPPETLPETGVGLERETALSSAFVSLPGYGTRCSAVLAVSAASGSGTSWRLDFCETTHQMPPLRLTQSLAW